MNIDEDDFSDDYDFMDDDDEQGNARRRTRAQTKQPKLKYKELLQKVADRYEDEITIELDDIAKVGATAMGNKRKLTSYSTMRHWRRMGLH